MARMSKSKLMKSIEVRYKRPLEKLLPEMYNEKGLPDMAEELGVSRSTVYYWILKYGVNLKRIALASDETLEVKKTK